MLLFRIPRADELARALENVIFIPIGVFRSVDRKLESFINMNLKGTPRNEIRSVERGNIIRTREKHKIVGITSNLDRSFNSGSSYWDAVKFQFTAFRNSELKQLCLKQSYIKFKDEASKYSDNLTQLKFHALLDSYTIGKMANLNVDKIDKEIGKLYRHLRDHKVEK